MKAYSFYFNTSDWLASPAVKMMSKAERGVYIGLLASAWESPVQGTLPASVDKVRRLSEMSLDEWAESGETLLEKFPLSECGTYRYNPRLLAEATKEQARSDKAKKSADMRWQCERNANASKSDANAPKKACVRNAQVKVSKETTNVVVEATAAPEPLKAKSKAEIVSAQVAADGGATFTADTFTALNDPTTFANLMDYLGHVGIDTERYRLDIRGKVKAAALDVPATALGKYIVSYLTRELASGPLTPAPVATRPAPVMPADPCSLWGAPNPDYDHRAYSQPAGQYSGTIQ